MPVSRHRDAIRDALREHPVVIVCGDTGSGKTTQLPKIALELGLGKEGKRIGCTQPRRLAATSVARRVAEELNVEVGQEVGYQIRFEDRTNKEKTAVKFMTDGILLAETRGDQRLQQYDAIIVDEAHERSLNIDFILGYLQRLLKKRRDLKIIISSATLDAETFSSFFGGAPVISVEGRTFPVEDHYQPPTHERERLSEQVTRAVEWLGESDPLGDTLVFLPGEREIRDAFDLLDGRRYPNTKVLPLFAKLAAKNQQEVFRPSPRQRRVILATNVAETSLTIPDIRSVVDSGIARMNRFDPGTGIQRLQVEDISKASARQRRGRCGRVSEGICVRLYDEEDFESRQDYTDPEILRSNLAGVVLQMEHLGLGDPLKFPFIDPPQPKRISDAYRTLEELGAIQKGSGLTDIGHTLARLPLDPRVGRLLVAAEEEGCLREGLIVASALTVQDPRDRPQEKREAADQAHARFRDKTSDFTGWLRWWHGIEQARTTSNNSLRKFCQKNFLNYRRTQEWQNLHRELRDVLRDLRWKLPDRKKPFPDPEGTYLDTLHRAILTAIPSHIGFHQGKKMGYKGARDRVFHLFPGSGVFGTAPAWVMAFELTETARLYARDVAMFDPTWFEKAAPHLCRYRYGNPQWDKEQGVVYGEERVTAFGLTLIDKRRVHYGRVNPEAARQIFILEALVNGETRSPLPALKRNRQTLETAHKLEHKLRRRDGLVFPEYIREFYEERVPEGMHTQKQFEQWVSSQPADIIDFDLEDCLVPQVDPIPYDGVPDTIPNPIDGSPWPLSYLHDPSKDADGITVDIPLARLEEVPEWFGDWLVEAWLPEKLTLLVRSLDKNTRQRLPSIAQVCDSFLSDWEGYEPSCTLQEAVRDHLHSTYDVFVANDDFDSSRMPLWLRMRYRILGDKGKPLAAGRDLNALKEHLAVQIRERFQKASRKGKWNRVGLTRWSVGDLPEHVEMDVHTLGYPALYDEGRTAGLRLFPSETSANWRHAQGVARLYCLTQVERIRHLETTLFKPGSKTSPVPKAQPSRPTTSSSRDNFGSLAAAFGQTTTPTRSAPAKPKPVARKPDPDVLLAEDDLLLLGQVGERPATHREDLITLIVMEAIGNELPRKESGFLNLSETLRQRLFGTAETVCEALRRILDSARQIASMLDLHDPGREESLEDARAHFQSLLSAGWLLRARGPKLSNLALDLQGLETRLTRMKGAPPARDLSKLERFQSEASRFHADAEDDPASDPDERLLRDMAIHDQENDLRLLHFAPELRSRRR